MAFGVLPAAPLDRELMNRGFRAGTRTQDTFGPGSLYNPVVGSSQLITTIERYENPATHAVPFPVHFFGHDSGPAANGPVAEMEEHDILLWTLCAPNSPWEGGDPFLCILDFWLAWIKPANQSVTGRQESAIALTEEDENNSTTSITGGAYGSRLIIALGGGGAIGLSSASQSDPTGPPFPHKGGFVPFLGAVVDGEFHRWTIVARTRDSAGRPGRVRFYYDETLVWEVPPFFLPKAATYLHGFVAAGDNQVSGTEIGQKIGNLNAYHTRKLSWLPFVEKRRVFPVRTKLGLAFRDQFNRPNNNNVGNGWNEKEAAAGEVRILNNTLRMDTAAGNAWVFQSFPKHPEDFIARVISQHVQANSNSAIWALVTGASASAPGGSDGYFLGLRLGGFNDIRLFRRKANVNTLLASAALAQANGEFWEIRLVAEKSGANRLLRGYATKVSSFTDIGQAAISRLTHTDVNPAPFGDDSTITDNFEDSQFDEFLLCGRGVKVRGLQEGWTVRFGTGDQFVAGANGEIEFNVDTKPLPVGGGFLVLDEDGLIIGLFQDEVFGGDEFRVSDYALVKDDDGRVVDEHFDDGVIPSGWKRLNIDGSGAITFPNPGEVKVDNSGGGDFAGASDGGSGLIRVLPRRKSIPVLLREVFGLPPPKPGQVPDPIPSPVFIDVVIHLVTKTGSDVKFAMIRYPQFGSPNGGAGVLLAIMQNEASTTDHRLIHRQNFGDVAAQASVVATGSLDGKRVRLSKRGKVHRAYYESGGKWVAFSQDFVGGETELSEEDIQDAYLWLAAGGALGVTATFDRVVIYGLSDVDGADLATLEDLAESIPPGALLKTFQNAIYIRNALPWQKVLVDDAHPGFPLVNGLVNLVLPEDVIFPLEKVSVVDEGGNVIADLKPSEGVWAGDVYRIVSSVVVQ